MLCDPTGGPPVRLSDAGRNDISNLRKRADMTSDNEITEKTWRSTRLSIEIEDDFDAAVAKYEEAVPTYPAKRFAELAAGHAAWDTIVDITKQLTPHAFLIYWKSPADLIMGLAGHTARSAAYLMGNHVKAETMYPFDPTCLLYVPMRTLITRLDGENPRFTVDRPGSQLDSLDSPAISQTGREIDHQLVLLLEHLNWTVPNRLLADKSSPIQA